MKMTNRAARRAAASGNKLHDEHRITQVHEAGHAIGRILGAEAYGIPVEESVESIVMRIERGTAYGPMFPRVVQDALQEHIEAGKTEISPIFALLAIEKARERGVDIEGWLKARLIHTVMGPCAEAKFTDRNP
jgi:hypothetical protein